MSETNNRVCPDSFEVHVRLVLAGSENQAILNEFLELRQRAQDALRALWEYPLAARKLSADDINAQNQWFFDQAAALLGPERYERIFGTPPGTVTVVDPTVFKQI